MNDKTPRGIRNNNPGNIRLNKTIKWQGQIAGIDEAFCTFDKPESGIRAIAKILLSYKKRSLETTRKIITTWAPPEENDTEAYIKSVCAHTGLRENDRVSFADYPKFIEAVIQHENGMQPYSYDQIHKGVEGAMI